MKGKEAPSRLPIERPISLYRVLTLHLLRTRPVFVYSYNYISSIPDQQQHSLPYITNKETLPSPSLFSLQNIQCRVLSQQSTAPHNSYEKWYSYCGAALIMSFPKASVRASPIPPTHPECRRGSCSNLCFTGSTLSGSTFFGYSSFSASY